MKVQAAMQVQAELLEQLEELAKMEKQEKMVKVKRRSLPRKNKNVYRNKPKKSTNNSKKKLKRAKCIRRENQMKTLREEKSTTMIRAFQIRWSIIMVLMKEAKLLMRTDQNQRKRRPMLQNHKSQHLMKHHRHHHLFN